VEAKENLINLAGGSFCLHGHAISFAQKVLAILTRYTLK
jgi:hypothetical protein